ncbi:NAD(P)-binding protein, partial [Microbacterium foliorum]|uniref:protoporphyrinogen/coproporphyrinogen oxidase n=1 Tax=Microbacterium foliorum TaxID=104336 RepID=UPI0028D5A099
MTSKPAKPANSESSRPEPVDLAARAATRHIVVVGGGVGGLIAARECVKVGMHVTLLEASDAVGGAIRRAELDGVVVDAGAESYATRGGRVRALLAELDLSDRIVAPAAGGAWLAGIPGVGAAPLPVGGILGIPGNPFQEDVRRVIGWSGAWRAYLDRIRPPLTIGHNQSLGRLVSSRMGAKVRDRLVAPVTTGVYSASPDDVDVDIAAPGLNAALTSVGSLSGAVQALREQGAARAAQAQVAA